MAGIYRYPIEHQEDFQGTISFEALVEPEVDFSFLGGVGYNTGQVDPGLAQAAGADLEQFTGGARAGAQAGVNGVVPDGRVTLYLPQAIQIQDGASYDNSVNLGTLGAIAENAINAGARNIYNAATTAVAGDIETFISGLMGSNVSQDLARVAAVRMSEAALGQELSSAVKSATRTVVNPNTRTLFRSVPIRAFNFDFTLIPTSAREAQEINNIIRFFRTQLYPEDIGGTSTTQGIYGLKFPNKFEIKMMYRNKQIGSKFLPSYLTNFSATYNRQGGAMHKDGNWNDVNINMSFVEARSLVKQDIQGGY